ncbi:MAG TPA: hypothetical protein PKH40_00095 [Treponemataceae bacterium]|jgi:hypothetical protein|nr:MAG: hypothetical protein BWY39_01258 [Spirochaetes bacterium ADurb.Bin269]TAH54482.1 MAG: hypothetical protein EWM51_06595 [Treponema sp.]HOC28054.1 hypothetical protein [Treponemataceae bacterium]HPX46782.1 hypothetical protein [Treponemataceae bacterium]HQL31732.1 hypothetical protein [Treponemataceae bacterium]
MAGDRSDLMSSFNDDLDRIRTSLYTLLDFDEESFGEKKDLAKREVLFALNELRIRIENL